jgi:hypothetical protein
MYDIRQKPCCLWRSGRPESLASAAGSAIDSALAATGGLYELGVLTTDVTVVPSPGG